MLPPAPPRLSITTGWPNALEMRSPTRRPTMSALPPAANGTIRRIGRSGYFANASRPSSTRTGVNPRLAISLRREIDMEVLGFLRRGRENCLDRKWTSRTNLKARIVIRQISDLRFSSGNVGDHLDQDARNAGWSDPS